MFLTHPIILKYLTDYPILLDRKNKIHLVIFTKLLELSYSEVRWNGHLAKC